MSRENDGPIEPQTTALHELLEVNGRRYRVSARRVRALRAELAQLVAQAHAHGASYRQIAHLTGIPKTTLVDLEREARP